MRQLTRPQIWFGAVFALGCAAALYAANQIDNHQQSVKQERFEVLVDQANKRLAHRVQLYEYGLRGTRGAVISAGVDSISRATFLRYSESRELRREFPGSRGFGYIRRVAPSDESRFLKVARADGVPDFRIQELAPHSGDHLVIQFIEPVAMNRAAIGLDIASEANRRQAAIEALSEGQPTLTKPITLVQASGKVDQGFLFFLPVYRPGEG